MKRALAALGALGLHAALVVWLTWPLGAWLTTHLPDTWINCRKDALLIAWALAHQSRALVAAPWDLPNGNIFHPTPHALFFGEAGFGAVPFFMGPFLLTGNPTLALNLTFLAGVTLTAWSLHLVVLRWTGSHLGGALAGVTFLTTPWVLWGWIPSAPNYAVLPYLPWIIFLAAAPVVGARLLGLVVLQGLTSVYVLAATVGPLVVLALGRLARRSTRAAGLRLAAVLGLALALLLVPYSGYLVVHAENPLVVARAALYGLSPQTPLPWGVFHPPYPTAVQPVAFGVILAGGIAFLWRWSREGALRTAWTHGAFWAATGLLVSLTPIVDWRGQAVTLPHALLADRIPVYTVLRFPARLGLASLMGFALLTGIGFATCARAIDLRPAPRRATTFVLSVLVAATMYATYLGADPWPALARVHVSRGSYPLFVSLSGDSLLVRLLEQPGGPLLELPVGAGPIGHAEATYRSIFHRRRLLNGYSGYWPSSFPERMALACRLPDPEALATLRRETGLEMILVHLRSLGDHTAPAPYRCSGGVGGVKETMMMAAGRWLHLAQRGRQDLLLVASDDDALLFRTDGRP